MIRTRCSLFVLILWSGASTLIFAAQAAAPQNAKPSHQERIQIPEPADPAYRATIEAIRKRIEAMPENTYAQKEDKLALRKYLETRLIEIEFQRISVMDEPEYSARLDAMKKDLDRLPENTTARRRDKRELQIEFERRRVDLDLYRLTQGKTVGSTPSSTNQANTKPQQ